MSALGDGPAPFLEGLVVEDRTPLELGMTGRILADLGATVVRTGPEGPEAGTDPRWQAGSRAWRARTVPGDDPSAGELAARADVVLVAPAHGLAPVVAPVPEGAVVVRVTPFGAVGPRAGWTASDLGIAAASGNLWATGDDDRPPVRCSAPLSRVHVGAEAALAALAALASGRPGTADVSMAETMEGACIGSPAGPGSKGERGQRTGAVIGRTREIWPCRDGWVSFGLRGGPARVPSLKALAALAAERGDRRLDEVDWSTYYPATADPALVATLTDAMATLFATMTLAELDRLSGQGVLVAPVLDAAAVAASEQLADRGFLGPLGDDDHAPRSFGAWRTGDGGWSFLGGPPAGGAPAPWAAAASPRPRPWEGTQLLELGAGVAGPATCRYFAEQGATVIRVESSTRPDFLRLYAMGPDNPHGMEGSPLFTVTNPGKFGVTLNMKEPAGRQLVLRLAARSHAVVENFTPGVLDRLGLGYEDLRAANPSVVLVSSSFHGQTGPRRTGSGFGALGSALSGFNHLTGWPDRAPVGPATTITDSLTPRFAAAALAAALLHQRRGGGGAHLCVSQVECALFSLSPWLVRCLDDKVGWDRDGNRCPGAVPHGVFPCAGDDRWVAVAVWTDEEWERLRPLLGADGDRWAGGARHQRADEAEALLAAWTAGRDRAAACDELRALGVEAVPVEDNVDLLADPTLGARGHFVTLEHEVLGPTVVERAGYRLDPDSGGYDRPTPTLGRDNEAVLCGMLGLSPGELAELVATGVVA